MKVRARAAVFASEKTLVCRENLGKPLAVMAKTIWGSQVRSFPDIITVVRLPGSS